MSNSFYGRLYAESYDTGDQRHEALSFYLQEWDRVGRPAPVLEPMCGTGFFLLPFLRAGADIDGLDSSPYMLSICRDKCNKSEFAPVLYEQALETMELPKQYAFVFIPDRSFAHIWDREIAQRCLRKIFNHVTAGGWFLIEVKTPPKAGEFGEPGQTEFKVEDRADGSTIVSTSIWGEREQGKVIRNWTKFERYVQGSCTETEIFDYNERFYHREEFMQMLAMAGFVDISMLRAHDGAEPQEHDIVVFICQKPTTLASNVGT